MKVQIKGFPLLIIHGYKWIAGYRGHFTKIFDGEKRNKGKKSSRKVEAQEIESSYLFHH